MRVLSEAEAIGIARNVRDLASQREFARPALPCTYFVHTQDTALNRAAGGLKGRHRPFAQTSLSVAGIR
ncbi:MAG TPA: hypothetical protein GX008_01670 [Firmicutes bacterium]|nr:hypothetical protein [Bacillota bacterium]